LQAYLEKTKGNLPKLDLSVFKDKVCFIGLTAAGTEDLRATPLEKISPMLAVQASVFNSLITRQFIKQPAPLYNALLALAVFFACSLSDHVTGEILLATAGDMMGEESRHRR
jgi:CHASE2 domain-containing sensor protein